MVYWVIRVVCVWRRIRDRRGQGRPAVCLHAAILWGRFMFGVEWFVTVGINGVHVLLSGLTCLCGVARVVVWLCVGQGGALCVLYEARATHACTSVLPVHGR